jgi:hypothetical protein
MIGITFKRFEFFYGFNFKLYGDNIYAISGQTIRIVVYVPPLFKGKGHITSSVYDKLRFNK